MFNKIIKRKAIKAGLCKDWQKEWEQTGLIEKYIIGIDWCMRNEFPSYRDMSRMEEALLRNGVYNKKRVSIESDRSFYVFNGCDVDFTIKNFDVSRIYIGRGTKITVNVKDNAILYIDNYSSTVTINKEKGAKCIVWDETQPPQSKKPRTPT